MPEIETPFGPVRVHLIDGLPDDVVLVAYSPPAPGTRPGDPDWVPLERRAAMIVDRPEPGAAQRRERSEPPKGSSEVDGRATREEARRAE